MKYARMIMEAEAANLVGYDNFKYNLSESSVRDRSLLELGIDLGNMELPYGHHYGHPGLRRLIAEQSGENIKAENVLVTAGAAGALFLVATCLLDREDQLVVGFPNYATNFETPYAIGCEVVLHEQEFEKGFQIDIDKLESQITDHTKYVSLTCPHNPTGVMISEDELRKIIDLVERKGVYLLFDETYRDLTYGQPLPVAATLSDKAISVCSMSKTWGVPGIRIGWLVTRNQSLMDRFIAAKEQIGITGSVIDEEIAYQILQQYDSLLPAIQREVAAAFDLFKQWIGNEKKLEWCEPGGGVTCFARIPGASEKEMEEFYECLKTSYKTYVAPGYWFKMPTNYMRIGFGWTTPEDTREGLQCISKAIKDCFGEA